MSQVAWKPNPGPQTEALTRPEFEVLYGGARGGGKTDAGMAWMLRNIEHPQFRGLVIRRNADDLKDWIARAKVMYRNTGAKFRGNAVVITFPSGATITTGHLKDADAYTKYQGHEYQQVLIEELTQIPREDDYMNLIGSCRSTLTGIRAQVFATTNPGGVGHAWVKGRFVDINEWGEPYYYVAGTQTLSRIYIPATVDDNPVLAEKDPRYVAFLDSFKDKNPSVYRAWRHGDWDIVAGQVFSEWRREHHVVKPFQIPPDWKRYISMDWGVNDPTSVGWFAVDYDNRTYMYRELHMNGMDFQNNFGATLTPSRMARLIKEINKREGDAHYSYMVCDPSLFNRSLTGHSNNVGDEEGESIAETFIRQGIRLIRGDNDRISGLERVRENLSIAPDGKPFLQVFENCHETIRSIPSLAYDMHKIEDVDQNSRDDHEYDMIRYFCMSRPSRPRMKHKEKLTPVRNHLRQLMEDRRKGYMDDFLEF